MQMRQTAPNDLTVAITRAEYRYRSHHPAILLLAAMFLLGTVLLPLSLAYAFQAPLSLSADEQTESQPRDSDHIFNSLAGLLTQLPNTIRPNGHTLIPATISPHIFIYHSRPEYNLPPKREWLAFDPEMSYSIFVPKGSETWLTTYRTTRRLNVLYFDGMSAEWSNTGTLDLQEVFLARKGRVLHGMGWFDDYSRLNGLCDWAEAQGNLVDGFIRMNAGFEVMFCNFEYGGGLEMTHHINITAPDTPPRHRRWPWEENLRNFFPAEGRPPWGGWLPKRSPLTYSSGYEWLRTAVNRYHVPPFGVRLRTSGMVTLYDPIFSSLSLSRWGKDPREHRIWESISDDDAEQAVRLVEEVIARPHTWDGDHSEVEWDSVARRVQEYWGGRIKQIHHTLTANSSTSFNATRAVLDTQLLAYTLLNPYLDTTFLPHTEGPFPDRHTWKETTIQRCIAFSIPQPTSLTPQEDVLRTAIQDVVVQLCNTAADLFAQSLGSHSTTEEAVLVHDWTKHIGLLMRRLDWATWVKCEEECGWNSLCLVPIWPVTHGRGNGGGPPSDESPSKPQPACTSFDNWVTSPQGMF